MGTSVPIIRPVPIFLKEGTMKYIYSSILLRFGSDGDFVYRFIRDCERINSRVEEMWEGRGVVAVIGSTAPLVFVQLEKEGEKLMFLFVGLPFDFLMGLLFLLFYLRVLNEYLINYFFLFNLLLKNWKDGFDCQVVTRFSKFFLTFSLNSSATCHLIIH